ncbi:uncharacterized protein NECHADRAFT_49969 [Fusarium vanettenii 77-13-4]|uniref:Protein root UVB sensitive/RUS domain-containing protein n=1 Tax=Fusarium vanettenii (strain ATCC MYA-4622 / CBS 123669 / FGSC 9596 / NRRL 45880 / 77-13-4) TaxID=660122 RepID=C7ZP99_FUSV7|nr:uncharacterized protein NECHADRAFT_49969 [Fusarium vanettenii 77-13-4]EEU34109.1 hypothetical protein NECHADRAFT_49969 [Fusarium vanettenii 77-13-4]
MEGLTKHLGRGREVEVIDLDKSGNVARRWVHMPSNRIIRKAKPSLFKRSMRKILMDAFLPVGYPHSVSDDYLAYQFFDSLQAFFSTITALLANRALLQGLGVGDANSSATFAMLLTVLKDAMSRVATIIFAQQFGLRIEPDAKRYRFLADLFNDTAFFMELYSPYFGPYGKILALTSGEALRALCGVAGGASKAALSVHFAKHDNLAELNAKEASQETAVGLVGLLVGTFVVKHVEDHTSVVYLMTVLVLAHLWMNYLGVRSVCMNVLNRQRATILYKEYLKSGNVLTPNEVARRESILFWSPVVRNQHGQRIARIEMADSFGNAMGGQEARVNIAILDGLMSTLFIWSHASHKHIPIKIMLWKDSEAVHAISAWFMAMEIAWQMDKGKGYTERLDRIFYYQQKYDDRELWEAMLAKGWNLASQAFETEAPVRMAIQHEDKKDQ